MSITTGFWRPFGGKKVVQHMEVWKRTALDNSADSTFFGSIKPDVKEVLIAKGLLPTDNFSSYADLVESLIRVTIPNSVTQINSYAFYNCNALPLIELPNSLKTIENYAFRNYTSLTSITIPSSVTSIANYAFQGCTALTEIVVNKAEGSISGEPWGAPNATVT